MTRAESVADGRAVVAFLVVAAVIGLTVAAAAPLAVGASSADAETHSSVESFAATADGDSVAQTADDDADVIRLRTELSQTGTPGTVAVTTRAELPDRVTELEVTLLSASPDAEVEATGFDPVDGADPGESVWAWDGETADPSLRYVLDANQTVEQPGPFAGEGAYRFVATGEWALVQTPRLGAGWTYTGQREGQVRLERERVVDGPGVASQSMAFLGEHEAYTREAAGQRYRLIVPAAATLVAAPDEVFDVFADASVALPVGARDETVVAFAAPTGEVSWGVRGLQTGEMDLWVRDVEPAGTATDVWTHEYVHTRQAYRAAPSGRWITEASATHYAALFALSRGAADFPSFERTLARGEREPDASAVLADPTTWRGNPDYTKGALVAGEIDRRLRTATDGAASLATVVRELNEADEPITNEDILNAIEAAAAEGTDDATAAAIRAEAERLTATRESPEMWDREAHAAAFGETPAQVGYALTDDGVRATGEYRNRTVSRAPVELVVGESLATAVAVSNTGGAPGSYDLSLAVDGETVASRSGTLAAGDERVERFEHTFDAVGDYEVRVGGEVVAVSVTEPAEPLVRGVSVNRERVDAGGRVVATATVENDAGVPAAGDVDFRVDGETVATDAIRLDAGETTTIARSVRVGADGGPIGGGSENATIRVVSPVDEASSTVTVTYEAPISSDGAPGFGVIAALVAVFTVAGALGRERRRER
ncbi:hypothetical protein [Halorubrum sp. PV6]|uniref:hypothetical protein n=1 Tax=Halorubrum sp. PV6 TaxID=634157 RepID=UPI000F852649|nr:hypothetical protein [Halorubrum sp. PV6]AZQ14756.1 hypothetical protein DOS48_07905 [Halorubrum sp. PV6]